MIAGHPTSCLLWSHTSLLIQGKATESINKEGLKAKKVNFTRFFLVWVALFTPYTL